VYRVLKPGSYFVSYEWVATEKFDPNNKEHVRIMDEINFGNGLPVRWQTPCGRARAVGHSLQASSAQEVEQAAAGQGSCSGLAIALCCLHGFRRMITFP
jgi:hypothetical protein